MKFHPGMKNLHMITELNQIADNKGFWGAIIPLLGKRCIQSSAVTLISGGSVISGDFKLAQAFEWLFAGIGGGGCLVWGGQGARL